MSEAAVVALPGHSVPVQRLWSLPACEGTTEPTRLLFVGQVILDLEEERQRHAQDTAEGDDVTYMLEKERERLTQQVQPTGTPGLSAGTSLCEALLAFITLV